MEEPGQRYDPVGSSNEKVVPSEHEYFKTLENEQEKLSTSLQALTSHFAQVQFRLRQIISAPQEQKNNLIENLDEFASRGIPEFSSYTDKCMLSAINQQQVNQIKLINKLQTELSAASNLANEKGIEWNIQSSESIVNEELVDGTDKEFRHIKTEIFNLDAFVTDLRYEALNLKQMTESMVGYRNFEKIYKKHNGSFKNSGSMCDSLCDEEGSAFMNYDEFKSINEHKKPLRTLKRYKNSLYEVRQRPLTESEVSATNHIKYSSPKVCHWGNIRAKLEIDVRNIISVVSIEPFETCQLEQSNNVTLTLKKEVTKMVRKELCGTLRELIEHGTQYEMNFLNCCIRRGSQRNVISNTSNCKGKHAWDIIMEFYNLNDGNRRYRKPCDTLNESFQLKQFLTTSTKEQLLRAIGDVVNIHVRFNANQNSYFKAFVLLGLNFKKLPHWLSLIFKCSDLIEANYLEESLVCQPEFVEVLECLDLLSKFDFNLPVGTLVDGFDSGRCGHGSPCMQLCYELHDGMYECDCTEGYELDQNGYSCQEINSTFSPNELNDKTQDETDVLYQKGASFSAKLDNSDIINNHLLDDINASGDSGSDENFMNSIIGPSNKTYNQSDKLKFTNTTTRTTSQPDYHSKTTTTINNSQQIFPNNEGTSSSSKSDITYYSKEDMSVYDDVNNNRLNLRSPNSIYQENLASDTSESDIHNTSSKGSVHYPVDNDIVNKTSTTKLPSDTRVDGLLNNNGTTVISDKLVSKAPCLLDCGMDGKCDNIIGDARCLCPFGKSGVKCEENIKVNTPRFSKKSWMAFPALRGAYKHVQLHIEFRPESYDGIILLTGERDDLTGDFMAVLIHQGFIEFWFDCGSGTGKVKSQETVLLNQWNSITVYRHRWDAWLLLNEGSKVQGRSKGLFSRITFREPVFLGGTGNITGLATKLPVFDGLTGCIRKFIANEHEYNFEQASVGDVTNGFDVQECTTDRCGRDACHHGGKCLPSDQGAVCLCPLGFGGDLCEMRLDLMVPSFNGSSYLRYAAIGDSSLIWFELKMIIKPHLEDGLLLYSGHHDYGDYILLCLNMGFVEFSFDLGSGPAVVRSEVPLSMGHWHIIKISRTARLAVLKVDQLPEIMTISPNGFWHLSLPHSWFLGGIQNIQNLALNVRERGSFVGCIQKVELNGRPISIVSEALGGTNVVNCPHACVARPCGPLAKCVPHLENYECQCNPTNTLCNKAEELSSESIRMIKSTKSTDMKKIIKAFVPDNTTPYPIVKSFNSQITANDTKSTMLQIKFESNNPVHSSTEISVGGNAVDTHLVNENDDDDDYYDDDYKYDNNNSRNTEHVTPDNVRYKPSSNELIINHENATELSSSHRGLTDLHNTSDEKQQATTHVRGRYMSIDNEQLLKEDRQENDEKLKKNYGTKNSGNKKAITYESDRMSAGSSDGEYMTEAQINDGTGINFYSEEDVLTTKELIDDMERIMKNGEHIRAEERHKTTNLNKNRGACFTGTDSYFHYNDAETMREIISYKIDLNLRFKTHSTNGLILWTGRHSALEDDDYLSLGIENGYLHMRYNLGSGEVNIVYNSTRVSDGLWHRIRALRSLQEGTLEVDGGRTIVKRSPGKLRQLNTDTGLYVGGMPEVMFYTRRRYLSGIIGCISELVLTGELRLSLNPETLGTAHNVEPGIF